ncbi:MAG: hypothetical protein RLZZ206_861 [Cyanobacteriota bacterium]|jgi:hypothetical protein
MASQHTGGLFCWKPWLRFAAHRHLASNADTPFSRAGSATPPPGSDALAGDLQGLPIQPMASAALTEGQVALDTCDVGHGAGAADSRAPQARVSDGGL